MSSSSGWLKIIIEKVLKVFYEYFRIYWLSLHTYNIYLNSISVLEESDGRLFYNNNDVIVFLKFDY